MSSTITRILITIALAAGCSGVEYRGTVAMSAATPDLVAVAPSVQVIADYDEPIFFADGFFWWFFDEVWYRSATYTGGWVYVAVPPVVIVGIHEPYRYRHYRPHGYVAHRRPVPANRVQRPVPQGIPSLKPRLLYRDSQGQEVTVKLSPTETIYIGRSSECTIRTDDASVSRRHAQIRMEAGRYVIEDLGSASGSHVNNTRVEKQALSHGDVVRCGSLIIRFADEGSVEVVPPKVPPASAARPGGEPTGASRPSSRRTASSESSVFP